jgi:hypothetical protein
MTMSETDDDDEHKRICCDCVGEEYLSKEIATSGKSRRVRLLWRHAEVLVDRGLGRRG